MFNQDAGSLQFHSNLQGNCSTTVSVTSDLLRRSWHKPLNQQSPRTEFYSSIVKQFNALQCVN